MSSKSQATRQLALFVTIPTMLLAGPIVGFFLGDFLDAKWGTAPWLMTFFLIIGMLSAVRETILLIRRAAQQDETSDGD
jgi:F0F1-type ATP synthase assembly protein I